MFFNMPGKEFRIRPCVCVIYMPIKYASRAGFVTAATGIEMKQRKVRIKAEMVITLEPLHVKEITSQTVIEISFKATPRPI